MTEHLLSGTVTDFDGTPLEDSVIRLIDSRFEDLYATRTGPSGRFELRVEEGIYYAFYACKDYKVDYLEYWAWNVPVFEDTILDTSIGGLEVYGLNAFRVQGGYPALTLYFRPMSLARGKDFERDGPSVDGYGDAVVDIVPRLEPQDLRVEVNGSPVEIFQVNGTLEYGGRDGGRRMLIGAYLVQVGLPGKAGAGARGHHRVDVEIEDRETRERGRGTVFFAVPRTRA